jgi:hypothetical protein
MTSDKTGTETAPSPAQVQLEYSMGIRCTNLGDLRPEEFDAFLLKNVRRADLRELRGFVPLRDLLLQLGTIRLAISDNASITFQKLPGYVSPIPDQDLRTQAVRVCGGEDDTFVYRRTESEEETTSHRVAHEWGKTGYLYSGHIRKLVLLRASRSHGTEECLFTVEYRFQKVVHEERYLIFDVTIEHVPLVLFRGRFGDKYPTFARSLFAALRDMYYHTHHALQGQTESIGKELQEWEKVNSSIQW